APAVAKFFRLWAVFGQDVIVKLEQREPPSGVLVDGDDDVLGLDPAEARLRNLDASARRYLGDLETWLSERHAVGQEFLEIETRRVDEDEQFQYLPAWKNVTRRVPLDQELRKAATKISETHEDVQQWALDASSREIVTTGWNPPYHVRSRIALHSRWTRT
ncbi:unnamed protein product, partial [Amoebophrya sp. A120]